MMCHICKSFSDVSVTLDASVLLKQPTASSSCLWSQPIPQGRRDHKWDFCACLEELISGIWMCQDREPPGSEATQLWVRAEIKGRREVLWHLKQFSALVLWFLPHFSCFLFQALVLIPIWTMQKILCFGPKACVGMTNFLPASLWKSQRRTQCRKHHQWTPSPL